MLQMQRRTRGVWCYYKNEHDKNMQCVVWKRKLFTSIATNPAWRSWPLFHCQWLQFGATAFPQTLWCPSDKNALLFGVYRSQNKNNWWKLNNALHFVELQCFFLIIRDHDGVPPIVCVFHQAHSTPKWGWTDRGKDRLQKGLIVNSNVLFYLWLKGGAKQWLKRGAKQYCTKALHKA